MRQDPMNFILPANIPSMDIYDAAAEESKANKIGPAFFMRQFKLNYIAAAAVCEDLVRRGILKNPDKFLMCEVSKS